jgi:hypothetical protein
VFPSSGERGEKAPTQLGPLETANLNHWTTSVKVKVMLRPTVSRSVYPGTKHPFGAYDQILIIVWQLRVCWFGAPSLTRGRVCRFQLLLVIASAVIFGSESRRALGHILHSRLKFESYCPVHVGALSHERSELRQLLSDLPSYLITRDQANSAGDKKKIHNKNCDEARTCVELGWKRR